MMSSLHAELDGSIDPSAPYHHLKIHSNEQKFLALSPRIGIDDLPAYCTPFHKTGYTPRDSFSNGLTPQFHTPYPVSNPRSLESNMVSFDRISPSGYTPKDMSSIKLPMRFPDLMEPAPAFTSDMYEYMQRPMMTEPQDDLDERRRMKNRERVRKCRKRKQDRLNYLEDRTNDLERENGALKARIEKESMNSVELEELQSLQNSIISQYVASFTDEGYASVAAIYSDTTQVIYGNRGIAAFGLDEIIRGRKQFAQVFEAVTMKQYSVVWSAGTHSQCVVYLNMEAVLRGVGEENLPFATPFGELSRHLEPGFVLGFRTVCYITFRRDKIVGEIRQLDLQQVAETLIAKKGARAIETLMLLF